MTLTEALTELATYANDGSHSMDVVIWPHDGVWSVELGSKDGYPSWHKTSPQLLDVVELALDELEGRTDA